MSKAKIAVLLIFLLAMAATTNAVNCCTDNHAWGDPKVHHCLGPDDEDNCNTWCMQDCRGGICKIRNKLHVCHCYC
ncbi:hypothetical protein IEQ34_001857 [Dendrobium chrysotoxum]|uniref:Uncharacterized protein n=1 Tax=Dendrobium chrysotoxum TaxID=161865 RepID=A0AAV7HKA7_DENCH|nr:hypothetical protein IEQ34_001857 [Dendrobium chrysotoxum]